MDHCINRRLNRIDQRSHHVRIYCVNLSIECADSCILVEFTAALLALTFAFTDCVDRRSIDCRIASLALTIAFCITSYKPIALHDGMICIDLIDIIVRCIYQLD